MNLDACDQHFDSVIAATSVGEACYALAPLFELYEVMTLELHRGSTVFWRAREAPEGPFRCGSDVGCAPAETAKCGRLNDAGVSCFYGATRDVTALREVDGMTGKHYQLSGFKPHSPITVAVVGEFLHVQKTGYLRLTGSDPGRSISRLLNSLQMPEARRLLYIDAFLSDLLADPRAKQREYLLSRAVASMLYRDSSVDGIIFPSVKDPLGLNLSLRADSYYAKAHPVCSAHVRLTADRRFGFLDYEVLSEVEKMEADEFVWKQPLGPSLRRFFNLSQEEYEANKER